EVAGGGAKPWRQKGTGRARQGSIRSPHWRGGGMAHALSPRSYAQKTPKKMVRLALVSALSDRAADDKVIVIDEWSIDSPKTKDAVAALTELGLASKGKRKRNRRSCTFGKRGVTTRAIVTPHPDDRIDLFEGS